MLFLLVASETKSMLNSIIQENFLLSLPFFNHGLSFRGLAASGKRSTVRRGVLRLARGICKCVRKTKSRDSACPENAFSRRCFLVSMNPVLYGPYDCDVILSEMINSSHQCLADGSDVTCRNTPRCTNVDVLLYKMSMWLSLGSRTNLSFYTSFLSARTQIFRALCIYIIMFVFPPPQVIN